MSIINHLEGLVSNKLQIIKSIFLLFKLEARLAITSIKAVIVTGILLVVILLTLWVALLALMAYFIMLLFNSVLLGFAVMIGINIIVLFILYYFLKKNLTNMSFQKTRECISSNLESTP